MDIITPHQVAEPRAGKAHRLAPAVTVVGLVLAVNGLVGGLLLVDPRPYSEVVGSTVHLVHYSVWTGCLIALSQLWPRFAQWSSPSGRTIPLALLTLAAVGAALDACARFVLAFVTPWLGRHAPALLDSAPDAGLMVPLLASGVVAMAGVAAVAVSGFRRRVLPRGAAVLLGVGALAIPVLGSLSNVLVGAALVWVGAARRGRS